MRFFLLLALSFQSLVHAATFEYDAANDRFIYRGQSLPLNEDEHRFMRFKIEQSGPIDDLDFAIPMRWHAFSAKSNATRIIQQIDHRALVYSGALLLKHESDRTDFVDFQPPPPKESKILTLQTRTGTLNLTGHAARIARFLETQITAPTLEQLTIQEPEFIKIGLPLETYRQELTKINQTTPDPLIPKFKIHIRRTDYESKWDPKNHAFTPIKPDPFQNTCKSNL